MYQEAQVRFVDAKPCFAVADTDEARRTPPVVTTASVDEFTGADWQNVWQWTTPAEPPVPLSPDICIPYGEPLIAIGTYGNAPPLRPGARYHVAINSQIVNPDVDGDPVVGRVYSREFCLRLDAGGRVEVIVVPRASGQSQWDVCGS